MRSNFENDVVCVFLEGNIDTSNAEAVGEEINTIKAEHPEAGLLLDADDLKYISSAGLRQILKLKKANKNFKIINCSSEIYEIFEMTGFSEMMDISKAYRKISVDGCEVIGEGSNGVVYRINGDTIVKVYRNKDALEDIKRERELARTALVMGVNTAIPYDVVRVDDKYGSMFELLSSKSLTKWINSDHEHIDKYIEVFVNMLKEIHETPVKEGVLPSEKEVVLNWVKFLKDFLDEDHYNKLEKLVSDVEESNFMLHGDYHTNNVHYDQKEAILIDMDTICVGDPIFEFGSIYNAYQGYGITDVKRIENFLKISYEDACVIWKKSVQLYFGVEDIQDIENKCKIIGLTRVLRRTLKREPDNAELIDKAKSMLLDALDKVDTLAWR